MPFNPEDPNANEITRVLYDLGYTMREAGDLWNCSYQHVVNVARGRTRPCLDMLLGWKRLTGRPLEPYLTAWQKQGVYQPKFINARGRVDEDE